MRSLLFIIILNITLLQTLFAQEKLLGLPVNLLTVSASANTQTFKPVSTTLPFFDDFSYNTNNPDSMLWLNNDVLINNNYAKGMPSVGVATFDAINGNGKHYSNASSSPYIADKLISQYIDLQTVDTNSLWLSFYYQPQGYGNAPEPEDSLMVDVTVDGEKWERVWQIAGTSFQEFSKKQLNINSNQEIDTNAFKLVMIKLGKGAYKTSKFQFRFVNYASLSGKYNLSTAVNCDHWNIDYVYLNDNRNENDTVFKDIAFVKPPNSFLRNWQSVPWSHYDQVQKQELSKEYLNIRNNYNQVLNIKQTEFLLKNLQTNTMIDSFNISQISATPFYNFNLNWKFSGNPFFKVKNSEELYVQFISRLKTDDDFKRNNITTKNYCFKNYYAYDDGTAENAYGIEATGAKVAYKFKSYLPDSLKGISVYFLQTYPENEGLTSFNICVWENDNGKPGKLLLEDKGINPVFTDKINKFAEFKLSKSIAVDGEFFIGWIQKSKQRINIGFDKNTNSKNNLFYNIYGSWKNSSINGSLMMRPIVGHLTQSYIKKQTENTQKISLFPNPTSGIVYFKNIDNKYKTYIEIYNMQGKKLYCNTLINSSLDASFLDSGMYIVLLKTNKEKSKITRLIISK